MPRNTRNKRRKRKTRKNLNQVEKSEEEERQTQEAQGQQQNEEDIRMCRQCFVEEGEDEAEDCGQLMRVCCCKGSSEFVHDKCITDWFLLTGQRNCPTCRYKVQVTEECIPWYKVRPAPMTQREKKLLRRGLALLFGLILLMVLQPITKAKPFLLQYLYLDGLVINCLSVIVGGYLGIYIAYILHNDVVPYFSRLWRNRTKLVIKPYKKRAKRY